MFFEWFFFFNFNQINKQTQYCLLSDMEEEEGYVIAKVGDSISKQPLALYSSKLENKNFCFIYDEKNKKRICSHVNETKSEIKWLETKNEKEHACIQCAKIGANIFAERKAIREDLFSSTNKERTFLPPKAHLKEVIKGKIKIELFFGAVDHDGMKTIPIGAVFQPGDKTNSLYVMFQHGQIYRVDLTQSKMEQTPFFDIVQKIKRIPPVGQMMSQFADERGLTGFAFHPHYNQVDSDYHKLIFIVYSTNSNEPQQYDHVSILSKFKWNATESKWNESVILKIEQPQMNHNGGTIRFGPPTEDSRNKIGYLYYAIGDGGGANDEHGELLDKKDPNSYLGNAQNLNTFLGKLLRIDVNVPFKEKYKIPDENPYSYCNPKHKNTLLGEIYAYGLRNSWNFSFDKLFDKSSRLFLPDVGQNEFEEINLIEDTSIKRNWPLNFGWRALEGNKTFNQKVLDYIQPDRITHPIIVYDRRDHLISAVIGGYFYRGKNIPSLQNKYIFGDYNGQVFYAQETSYKKWEMNLLLETNRFTRLHSFAMDSFGELYLLMSNTELNTWSIQRLFSSELLSEDINAILKSTKTEAESGHAYSKMRVDQKGVKTTPKMHISVITLAGKIETLSMYDAWIGSWDISRSKAFTAMAFSSDQNALTSRSIGELSQTGPWNASPDPKVPDKFRPPLHNIGNSNPNYGITEFPGGIPIYKDGLLAGGLGVSGDGVDVDEQVALLGLPKKYHAPQLIKIDTITQNVIRYVK